MAVAGATPRTAAEASAQRTRDGALPLAPASVRLAEAPRRVFDTAGASASRGAEIAAGRREGRGMRFGSRAGIIGHHDEMTKAALGRNREAPPTGGRPAT
jgi:hypothetical protein